MKSRNVLVRVMVLGTAVSILAACGLDIPKEKQTSFETITVKKSDVELPMKFSAKLKGQSDVTITPQVSGQLMRICVSEGQRVSKGQTLFIIDSRNAQHEVEAARANSSRLHRPTSRQLRHRPTAPSWSMRATRTCSTRRL